MSRESATISKVLLTIEQYKGSLSAFCCSILLNEYNRKCDTFSRLFAWKSCLLTETLNIPSWELKLSASRAVYHLLKRNPEMAVPWSRLDADNEFYMAPAGGGTPHSSTRPLLRIQNVAEDPLSSHSAPILGSTSGDSSTWTQDDGEMLDAIIFDVQRLFPGEAFFHDGSSAAHAAKRLLMTVLYTWCKCNPNVGYKQGIHEILGLVYLNMHRESVDVPCTEEYTADDRQILSLFDIQYLEHDVFALFNRFIVSSGVACTFYDSEARLMRSIESFDSLLMKVDQLIHYNLITKLRLELPLWAVRFFRLLFLRELGNDLDVPALLWDMFVAAELTKPVGQTHLADLVICVTVTLLIHLKTELMLCDFSEALLLLLHYPISTKMNLYPDFMWQVFKDAYHLYLIRDKDLKLYEYGLKLNKMYNSRIRVNVSGSAMPSQSPKSSMALPTLADTRVAKMHFEKDRLEMRLKKKAQEILLLKPFPPTPGA